MSLDYMFKVKKDLLRYEIVPEKNCGKVLINLDSKIRTYQNFGLFLVILNYSEKEGITKCQINDEEFDCFFSEKVKLDALNEHLDGMKFLVSTGRRKERDCFGVICCCGNWVKVVGQKVFEKIKGLFSLDMGFSKGSQLNNFNMIGVLGRKGDHFSIMEIGEKIKLQVDARSLNIFFAMTAERLKKVKLLEKEVEKKKNDVEMKRIRKCKHCKVFFCLEDPWGCHRGTYQYHNKVNPPPNVCQGYHFTCCNGYMHANNFKCKRGMNIKHEE